ncbi:MAG: Fic family protein [Verrucomicrobia bacterium]|nr:Fic family protein [Verrucomicrobiota bacterium]
MPPLSVGQDVLKLISAIDEFKGAWKSFQNLAPDRLNLLRKVATVESIASSTRIEGVKLTDGEVERLLSNVGLKHFRSRDEQEVAGYAEAMNLVFESFADIPITENHIKQLHQLLLQYSSKDTRHRGEYKKLPNNVEAFDAKGKSLGIVFETVTPFDTPRRMQDLVEWINRDISENRHHILLTIAIFVVHFLAIHPFQDGNGRLSRILTTLLLLKAGYSYVPYTSLERIIEDNKDRYYLALRRAQTTLYAGNSRMSDWLGFFLHALRQQVQTLERKLEREETLLSVPKLSQDILTFARDQGRITVREIQRLTGTSRNTIKAHLTKLVENKRLTREGKGKATWYRL